MGRSRKRPGGPGKRGSGKGDGRKVRELLDGYHSRASLVDGDRFMVRPDQVLENITHAMERMDLDINTEVSLEDVASVDELVVLVQHLRLGHLLAAHVVNTGMRIMSARYPMELVCRPFPPPFDLRQLHPGMTFTDQEHETAKAIFNQRMTGTGDLDEDEVAATLESFDFGQQLQVFAALFFMYGSKVGALKYSTGSP